MNKDILMKFSRILEQKTFRPFQVLKATQRKIVEVILLNFRSNLGHKDKLEVI